MTFSTLLLMGCQPKPGELAGSEDPSADEARSPLEVVNLRMQAYNEHDLDALLSTYSEEVEIFTYPDQSLGKGKRRLESLSRIYSAEVPYTSTYITRSQRTAR